MLLGLSACSSSIKSEDQIISDIPDSFISVYINGEPQRMNVDSINIDKRQTDSKSDSIYFYLNMSNADFDLTAYCYFYYEYYNRNGGWVLDYCEIFNDQYRLTPVHEISENAADNIISSYFYNYALNDSGFDTEQCWYSYAISEIHDNCTYNGIVDVCFEFSSYISHGNSDFTSENEINGNWHESISDIYNMTCDWNIEGSWYSALKHNYELYLDISSFDGDIAYVEAVSPYKGNEYNGEERMEYNGWVELRYDYSDLGDPVLQFEFIIKKDGSARYKVKIYCDYSEVQKDDCPIAELYKI